MRPRREVILYCANAKRIDILGYVIDLDIKYRVMKATTPDELVAAVQASRDVACAVILRDVQEFTNSVMFLQAWTRLVEDMGLPTVEIVPTDEMRWPAVNARHWECTERTADIKNVISVAAQRRRGPKIGRKSLMAAHDRSKERRDNV